LLESPYPFAASALKEYFTVFEEGKTSEAELVHGVDGLECGTQAVEYMRRFPEIKGLEELLAPEPKMLPEDFQTLAKLLSQEVATSLKQQENIRIVFVIGIFILTSPVYMLNCR
jgi:hypothetical protein